MNLKCFFGHDWYNVDTVRISAWGAVVHLSDPWSGSDKKYSDRICKRCHKIEHNKQNKLERLRREQIDREKEAERVRLEAIELTRRFKVYSEMKDKAAN